TRPTGEAPHPESAGAGPPRTVRRPNRPGRLKTRRLSPRTSTGDASANSSGPRGAKEICRTLHDLGSRHGPGSQRPLSCQAPAQGYVAGCTLRLLEIAAASCSRTRRRRLPAGTPAAIEARLRVVTPQRGVVERTRPLRGMGAVVVGVVTTV